MLPDLPPELQLCILSRMDCPTLLSLASTSKHFYELSRDQSIWIRMARSHFGVRLKATDDFCPRLFYKHVLYPYRKALGVWQRQNLKFYGGLLRVRACSDCIVFEELIPPPKLDGTFKVQDFLKITYSADCEEKDCKTVVENVHKISRSTTVIIELNETSGLTIKLPDAEDHTENPDEWRDIMIEFANTIMGRNASMTDLLLFRFIETLHSRAFHRFEKLEPPKLNTSKCPITDGIFIGTYGSHGIEVIQVETPGSGAVCGTLGRKVTGDPNVSFDEITFKLTEEECLDMSREEQDSMATVETFSRNPRYIQHSPDLVLPYVSPVDCFERETVTFKSCQGRWSCECQIAQHGGYNPKFIPGHFILFDQDHFGVLFIELGSLVLYKRATDQIFVD